MLTRGESDRCGIRTEALDPAQAPAVGRRVTARGHRAVYATSAEDVDTKLSWTYGPGARASVSCFPMAQSEDLMLELAGSVRFERVSLRMPFTLAGLPPGLQVLYVGRDLGQVTALVSDRGTDTSGLSVQLPAEEPVGEPSTVRLESGRGQLFVEGGGVAVCRDVQGQRACVGADSIDGSGTPRRIAALTREVSTAPAGCGSPRIWATRPAGSTPRTPSRTEERPAPRPDGSQPARVEPCVRRVVGVLTDLVARSNRARPARVATTASRSLPTSSWSA